MRTILGKKHFETKRNEHPERKIRNDIHVIKILLDEIEYEVLQTMYKYGQMNGVQGEQSEGLTLSTEEKDWLDMVFKQAISELKAKTKPYLMDKSQLTTDELYTTPTEHDIVFRNGEGWTGSTEQVNSFAHDYVVASILAKWWYQGGNQSQGALYDSNASKSLLRYHGELNSYDIEPIMMEAL